jgi:hypothetical protein
MSDFRMPAARVVMPIAFCKLPMWLSDLSAAEYRA